MNITRGQVWRAKRQRGNEIRVIRVSDVVERNGNSYALVDNELGGSGRSTRIRFDTLQHDYTRIGT